MGIIWTIFLVFVAVMVIEIFDIKANTYQRKKKEKKKEEITEKKDEWPKPNLFRYIEGLVILITIAVAIYQALTK